VFDSLKKKLQNVVKKFSRKIEAEVEKPEEVKEKIEIEEIKPEVKEEKKIKVKKVEEKVKKKIEPEKIEITEEVKIKPEKVKTTEPEIKKVEEIPKKIGHVKKEKIGIFKRIIEKELKKHDVEKIIEELKLVLLESDVAYDVAEHICNKVDGDLIGKTAKRGGVEKLIKETLKNAILDILQQEEINIIDIIKNVKKQGRPATFVFLGFNGTGKCVSKDTLIPLSDGRILPIMDLYELTKLGKKEIKINDGFILNLDNNIIKVFSINKNLKIKNEKIEKMWKLKKDVLFNITLENGQTIAVTPEHPFFILESNKIYKKRADKITINDYIMIPKYINPTNNYKITKFEILKRVANRKLFVYSDILIPKIYDILKIEYGNLRSAWKSLNIKISEAQFVSTWRKKKMLPSTLIILMCEKYPEITKYLNNLKIRYANGHNVIPIPTFDNAFFEFLGLFIAEGHIEKHYIEFTNSDEFLLDMFSATIRSSFNLSNLHTKIDKRNENVKKVLVCNSTLSYLLKNLLLIPIKKKSKFIELPDFILSSPDDKIAAFIRAYWECDGTIDSKCRVLEATTKSKIFARQLSLLLLRFGIIASFGKRKIANNEYYRLYINGREKVIAFYKKIGTLTNKNTDRIKHLLAIESQFEKTELIPNQGKLIKNLRSVTGLTQIDLAQKLNVVNSLVCQYELDKYNVTIPIENLNKISNILDNNFLSTLSNADVRWLRVKEIKKIKNDNEYVYDLTISNSHNFVANNFIVHNTTSVAKLCYYLKQNNLNPVIAAGDTFRAASIEQLEIHSKKINIDLIKQKYGSDSAAVIYDARKHAESQNKDVVLADTAGRSHSNVNLMDELKKVCRVNQPDLKIIVLDALTGNDIVEQTRRFEESVGVDAIILTKADVYAKGGAALSAVYTIKKPILFLGTGQNYEDLEKFEPKKIADEMLGN